MPKLSEMNPSQRRTFLVYGESGAGKTVFATSFPGPVKVFDFDNKISSAAAFYKDSPERLKQIDYTVYAVDRSSKEPMARRPFRRFIEDFNKIGSIPAEQFPFKTIVIDSLTSFAEQLMQEEMLQNPDSNRQKMQDVTVPHLKDYQVSIAFTKNVITQILSLPCNVVFTGHIQQDKDETTGEITKQVAIWGKDLPGWIPKMCEEVYRLYTKEEAGKVQFWAQTRGANRFVARSQINKLPLNVRIDSGYEDLKQFL